jgi:cyclic dehypoxanthinyl futalosine synthase
LAPPGKAEVLSAIFEKSPDVGRISEEDALRLFREASLLELSSLATSAKNRMVCQSRVSYLIDRNVNYTNVCSAKCTFCAFHKDADEPGAFVLGLAELEQKAIETKEMGGTGFLLQGGINPSLPWEYYLEMVSFLATECGMWVHGFSPPEIQALAKINGRGLHGTLAALREAGLGSLPGGGAEILVDAIRQRISPRKGSAEDWLDVMDAAHSMGMPTTATMMFGITETIEDRILHLRQIREQQDRALASKTGGSHTAFAAWPFQSGNTRWHGNIDQASDAEYLRLIAVARIYLDNIPHIQSSWVSMGPKTGQVALHYGCDDMGSLMIEENVISSTGTAYKTNEEDMLRLIRQAGFEPWQRDIFYGEVAGARAPSPHTPSSPQAAHTPFEK